MKYDIKLFKMYYDLERLLKDKRFGEVLKILYKDRTAIREIIACFETAEYEIKAGILNILGRFGFDYPDLIYEYLTPIIKTLEANPSLRSDGAYFLGNIVFNFRNKSIEAIPLLREMLAAEDRFLRQDAAYAIGNYRIQFS